MLAIGAELKNTFCLTNGRYAFLSHHIGDMENYETLQSFEEGVAHFEKLFRVKPELIAYDLHPNYLATPLRAGAGGTGRDNGRSACSITTPTSPPSWPNMGTTATAQSLASALTARVTAMTARFGAASFWWRIMRGMNGRITSTTPPSPAATKPSANRGGWPWPGCDNAECGLRNRMLASSQIPDPTSEIANVVWHQMEKGINAPPTSSMGRLFDAVAALAGLRQTVNYEAQAAIEFEALADPSETGHYPFTIHHSLFIIDPTPTHPRTPRRPPRPASPFPPLPPASTTAWPTWCAKCAPISAIVTICTRLC